jgi:hypothetical protein
MFIPALAAKGAAIMTPPMVVPDESQLEGRPKEDHHMELQEKRICLRMRNERSDSQERENWRGKIPAASLGWIAGSNAEIGLWRKT